MITILLFALLQFPAPTAEQAVALLFAAWQVGYKIPPEPCPTTLDGLPMCPHVEMSTQKCLREYPPDEAGGFCNWYGYATEAQEDRFERRRGFRRVRPHDTLWEPFNERGRRHVAAFRKRLDDRMRKEQ